MTPREKLLEVMEDMEIKEIYQELICQCAEKLIKEAEDIGWQAGYESCLKDHKINDRGELEKQ